MSLPFEKQRLQWLSVKERVAHAYHDYGRLCAAHPYSCLFMSILTMSVLSYPALTRLQLPVSRPNEFYWGAQVHTDDPSAPTWLSDPPVAYIQQLIVRSTIDPWKSENLTADMSVRGSLAAAFRIRDVILNEKGIETICMRFATPTSPSFFLPTGGCLIISPASFWLNNPQKLMEDDDVLKTIFDSKCTSSFCVRDVFLGAPPKMTGIKKKFDDDQERTIEFAMNIFLDAYDEAALNLIYKRLGEKYDIEKPVSRDATTFVHVYYYRLKGFNDYVPLLFTYLIFVIYLYFSSRKFDMVASRWGLAFAAAFTVAATLVITSGICVYLDLSTTIWGADVYPYIALVLGLENILCITRSVVYTPPSLDVSSRIAHGLSQEGYKLTKYFALELFSLLCAYLTGVGYIQEFCRFSAICLVVDFYMQLFFYAPCLTFDLQRLGLEEKRRFTEILFSAEIPRLKNYAPISCPMRKLWPDLFVVKNLQKRRLSDAQIEDNEGESLSQREHKQSISIAGQPEWANEELANEKAKSFRIRCIQYITSTRIIQRTIIIGFFIWVLLALKSWFFSDYLDEDSPLFHNNLQSANLKYVEWQKRTYKWWPVIAGDYNISLPGRYITFMPPLVVNAKVSPDDSLLQRLHHSGTDSDGVEAPILRSRIDWLEMQLKVYLAAFWILLLSTVGLFFAYVCVRDRWKFGVRRVHEASIPGSSSRANSDTNGKTFVDVLPLVLNGHRFPIEAIGIDSFDVTRHRFVSCCQEGLLYVWNTNTGERVQRLNRMRVASDSADATPPPHVWTVAYRDGVVLVGCSDGSLEVASVERNKLIGLYTQSAVGISHIQLFECFVIIARLDGSIEFIEVHYDAKTESQPFRLRQIQLVRKVRAHQMPVSRMIVCGSRIISASFDRTIKIFDAATGQLDNVLLAHNTAIVNIGASADENVLFSSCEEGVICCWDLETGELVRTINTQCSGGYQIELAGDYLLGSLGNAQLVLWYKSTGHIASRIAEASSPAFNEDPMCGNDSNGIIVLDENIAATAFGTNVIFWDIAHRAILRQVNIGNVISGMRRLDRKRVLCIASNTMYAVDVPVARIK